MTAASHPRRWEPFVWPLLTGTGLLVVWALLVKLSGTDVFPSPLTVLLGLRELLEQGLLWRYVGDSLRRVGIGYVTAIALGVPAGLLLGWYP
ncbi:MAG TPA: hypothetical protein VK504_30150, partial [Vicinamibacterales bacterium]|nr:hypothetical protein [Vicinamibacterales bacterium]